MFGFVTKARYQKTKNNVSVAVLQSIPTFSSLKETPQFIIQQLLWVKNDLAKWPDSWFFIKFKSKTSKYQPEIQCLTKTKVIFPREVVSMDFPHHMALSIRSFHSPQRRQSFPQSELREKEIDRYREREREDIKHGPILWDIFIFHAINITHHFHSYSMIQIWDKWFKNQ